jgi:thioesterase domain-containing protein
MPTVQDLASDYVEMIRRQQPHGPYRIGGNSFGGIVAYEVAQQLRASGEEVAFIGLIDAALPESGVRYYLGKLLRVFYPAYRKKLGITVRRHLRRVAVLLGLQPKAEFASFETKDRLDMIYNRRWQGYAQAVDGYLPQIRPFTGNVELIVAEQRLAQEPLSSPDCGWRRHIASFRQHILDSDHDGLVEEPAVARVAEIFLEGMSRTETRRAPHEPTGEQAPTAQFRPIRQSREALNLEPSPLE